MMNVIVWWSPDNGAARCQGEMAPASGLACVIAPDWRAFLNLASPQPEEGARCRLHSLAPQITKQWKFNCCQHSLQQLFFPFFHFNEG